MIHRRHVLTFCAVGACIAGAPPGLIRESRAEVPCVIDVLEGTDPFGFSQPGTAVDIDGDRIVAGASSEGINAAGAIYVYVRSGIRWALEGKLLESPPGYFPQFGMAVAISGDRIIAGASNLGIDLDEPGRARVYRRIAGQWQEEALLTSSQSELRDSFGISVDMENDVAVVGSLYRNSPQPSRAFVFRWNGSQWIEEAVLLGTGTAESDRFGARVAMSGNRIAVAAGGDEMGDGAPGSVYIFKHNGVSWVQEARVRPDDDEAYRGFGSSVAIRGDELVVGADNDQTFSFSNGAVYVFGWNGAAWQQQAKLFPSNPVGQIGLGLSVDIGNDALVATGGFQSDYFGYVFLREGTSWTQRFKLGLGGDAALSDDASLLVIGNHVYGLGAVPPCVPVTSSWGVLVMALSVAIAGSICLRKRVKFSCVCVCVAAFGFAGLGGAAFAQVAGLEHPHHPENLIVRFKENTTTQARVAAVSSHAAAIERTDPYTDRMMLLKVAPNNLADTLVALRNDPDVLYAEPDYVVTFQADPNDFHYGTDYEKQWGFATVRAPQAWDYYTGALDFRVAVIDTGVAYLHPDLVNNIWTNPLEQPGDANNDGCPGVCGVDDDGDGHVDEPPSIANLQNGLMASWDDDENGYPDDFHGFDFAQDDQYSLNDNDPHPVVGGEHGTYVAGIIGAMTNNTVGVAGMAWHCKMVVLKFSGPSTQYESNLIEAMNYVIANNIRLSNNSWDLPAYSQPIYDKIEELRTKGHLFITAAGNARKDLNIEPRYPACYTNLNIITVGGSNPDDEFWIAGEGRGSNFGAGCVDLVAPAQHIKSTSWGPFPVGYNYLFADGTSFAAPFVTGAAALIMGKYPNMSYDLVRRRILDTARYAPWTSCHSATGGVLNTAAALGDCNNNAVLDATDIANQTSNDCDDNDVPDECDYDCDGNGIPDRCETGLRDPCCFPNEYCQLCFNLTPCECAVRGGISHPSNEKCGFFNCAAAPQ